MLYETFKGEYINLSNIKKLETCHMNGVYYGIYADDMLLDMFEGYEKAERILKEIARMLSGYSKIYNTRYFERRIESNADEQSMQWATD